MQSCVDSIPTNGQDVNAMLVFESEINIQEGFRAIISTSTGLTNVNSTSSPDDLDVTIVYGDEDAFEMFYREDCVCYTSNVKPIQGVRYDVTVRSSNSEIYEDVSAKMIFPSFTKPLEIEAISQIESDGSTALESSITLDGNSYSSNYYHILPYRKLTNIVLVDEKEEEEYTGEIEYLDLIDFDNNNLYIESHYSKPGFLVDFNEEEITLNRLNLLLHTPTVIDYSKEAFTKVFYEVRSVTESYYKYEIYQSRKLESLEGGIVEQPTMFGNIVNGRGCFGGYNTSIDSVSVK